MATVITGTLSADEWMERIRHFLQQPDIGVVSPSPEALARYASAFTHPSYIREQDPGNNAPLFPDNFERLEFLGDRVLNLVVAEYLFLDGDQSEGAMTSRMEVVRNQHLGAIVPSLGIGFLEMIRAGQNQEKTTRIIAAAFEAFIGAFYLDRGLEPAKLMLMRLIGDEIATFSSDDNYKKLLQERVQKSLQILPEYMLIQKTGPDHCPEFTYQVLLDKEIWGTGTGATKAIATQNAARAALIALDRSPSPDSG